jgi:PPOX class probable F420-dependent enzyme
MVGTICAWDPSSCRILEAAYKTRNLRRDPTAVLCVLSDDFFGRWMQIEGTAQILSLPDAMAGLFDYYRRISGEHPDWDDYRRAMHHERRVLVRVSIDAVGPADAG